MAIDNVIEQLEKLDESKYLQFVTEKGIENCAKCLQYKDKFFRRSDNNAPTLPIHPNCQCQLISVWDEKEVKVQDYKFAITDNKKWLDEHPIKGFEAPRFAELDQYIAECVADFNLNKAQYVGCSEEQAKTIPDITVALVKSWFIQETGGNQDAWRSDPAQVNKPGDWDNEKSKLGLVPPPNHRSGDIKTNIKVAVIILARKGFATAISPINSRRDGAKRIFDGWDVALDRYNRGAWYTEDGHKASEEYSKRIIRRAKDPSKYIEIEFKKIKK